MMTRFFVSVVVASGAVFALACSGSTQPVFGDDGGTGGGGTGPFGSLAGGNGSSTGGSTSGGFGSSGSSSGSSGSSGSSSGTSTSGGFGSSGTSTSGGGTSGGSSSGGSLAACGMNSTGTPACDQCLVTSCCNQFHACALEPQCKQILNCVGQCADTTCTNMCEQQYPNGFRPASDVVNCWSQNCKTACP